MNELIFIVLVAKSAKKHQKEIEQQLECDKLYDGFNNKDLVIYYLEELSGLESEKLIIS